KLDVPANAPMGEQFVQVKTAKGISNPIPVLVTDLPEAVASSVPSAASPAPLALGSAMNGRLQAAGDVHRFKFHAAKGQMITFEIEARRIDSRIDSVLTLRDAKGNEITSNDDAKGPDSRIEWTCPGDGDYLIDVTDLHRRGGDDFTYLLTARVGGP